MYRILVSDPLEKTGLAMLRDSGHDVVELAAEDKATLPDILGEFDALVVRSGTKVTADLLRAGAPRLRVVGRAGIGVDNVDTKAATELGILVVNAPTANLISATEHTFALLLGMARNIAKADADIKSENWNRKRFVGTELQQKTLGVIGFGRIGQAVARRARAFDMEILAFDPFLSDELVRQADATPKALADLMAEADVVTLHVPLTDQTRGLLDAELLRSMKQGALLVNCARGGIVDEETLLDMLDSGHLAGAALDVFAEEPPTDWRLAGHDNVVATPHLGAQTEEAQVRISTQTAQMVVAALEGSLAVTAVNLPFRPAGAQGEPYLRLAEKLGLLASTLADGAPDRLDVVFHGLDDGLHVPVTVAAIKGALVRSLGVGVNYVNAESVARERGLDVRRSVTERAAGYPNLLEVRLEAGGKTVSTVGTLFHGQEARVVGVAGYNLEFRPKGELLIVQNRDVPGVVGKLGTLLGAAGVNIAEIHLARRAGNDDSVEAGALAVVRLDQALDVEVVALVQAMDEVVRADALDIGDP